MSKHHNLSWKRIFTVDEFVSYPDKIERILIFERNTRFHPSMNENVVFLFIVVYGVFEKKEEIS